MNLAYYMPRLMAEIAGAVSLGRTKMDQHREFRQVFYGSDAGRRVLNDIFHMAGIYTTSVKQGDSYATHEREGARKLALLIATQIEVEPQDAPTQQITRMESE